MPKTSKAKIIKAKIIRSADLQFRLSFVLLNCNKQIGFVPTMGALHEGHLSLIRRSVKENPITVVSIYVNPLQFGEGEDFENYPRRFEKDLALCSKAGSEAGAESGTLIVFAPDYSEVKKPKSFVLNEKLESMYCGAYRPGHFAGVLTIVSRLFGTVLPCKAYFGEKDYQQLFLIRQMVKHLKYPIDIIGAKTVRERSGLAMSSRNEYMSLSEREAASSIYAGLREARKQYKQGLDSVAKLKKIVKDKIEKAGGKIQYIEIAGKDNLLPLKTKVTKRAIILVACHFGQTRLIDNCSL